MMSSNEKMNVFISEARRNQMLPNSIPIEKCEITLERCKATQLNADDITQQLNDLGLYCQETMGERLQQNIQDVISGIGTGTLQSFGVYSYQPVDLQQARALLASTNDTQELMTRLMNEEYKKTADGIWREKGTGQFDAKLRVICQKDNYEYLKQNFKDFPYCDVAQQTIESKETTLVAIKEFLINTASACTASTVKGIDETTLKAVFSNALAMINESTDLSNFSATNQNRVITLVENYNEQTQNADGIGIAVCEWDISIKDYKEKKSSVQHDAKMTVKSRSVVYRDVDILLKHYNAVIARNKGISAFLNGQDVLLAESNALLVENNDLAARAIQIASIVEVFDSLPPASEETFVKSLPCTSDQDTADVIVLYKGDLQKVGVLDNTRSSSESTFTKSLTSGFSMSSTVGFGTEINFEVDASVVKFGASISYNLSLTTQWNKENSETISFSVPAGKKAYLYQVTILCAKLRLDAKTATYRYVDYGKFTTNAYVTSNTPIYEENLM